MATLESRIVSLAQAIGLDIKNTNNAIGVLANLTTTQKSNVVAAINELQASIGAIDLSAVINDAATAAADKTYSIDKINSLLSAAKSEILGGIPSTALDTIKELADFLADNTVAGGLVEQLGNRVRADAAQSFTGAQQTQARSNIGAAAATDLSSLSSAIGNTDHNFVTDYTTAKV